jgi:orotidine-5'-phosphate decarboxylase
MSTATPQLIVALDYPDAFQAMAMAQQLVPAQPWVKVGLELLMNAGPWVVADLRDLGLPVFLDGKFHDIPNTVAGAVHGAVATGAHIVNVHASGGLRMMQAAREAADVAAMTNAMSRPLVIAVTVLTSLSEKELVGEIGFARPPREQVIMLARLAQEAGLDGVVASVLEAAAIKAACGPDFKVITPGIRLAQVDDDQRRVATPAVAVEAGADFLVVGRPITQAENPLVACEVILAEIRAAAAGK